jgi:hypothetical protein
MATTEADDVVTLTLPRSSIGNVTSLSADLLDRMHELLERNTEGTLNAGEAKQLETLVEMAQFGQLLTAALQEQFRC